MRRSGKAAVIILVPDGRVDFGADLANQAFVD